jgi:glycosyltransferase involved in cell wall biosynthesis
MTRLWDGGLSDVPRGFEIVHAMSLAAPPARNARRIVTVHDVTWREVPDAFPARGRRWHERALTRVLGSDALVVTPSERVEKELEAAGADPARLRVIPWGSDHLPPADLDAAQRLLSQLRVEGDFLLSVGTREPRKNLARVIAAFRRARPLLPGPWPLVVVGPPGWGLDVAPVEGVIVTGSLDDAVLSALYSRAKMLVYAPIAEGFGLPPLEAMREGLPVVSSPVPSSGGAVYEVDPLDVEQITDAIVEVASDDRTRSRLVAAGRAHSEALTWRASARAHVALWRSLA